MKIPIGETAIVVRTNGYKTEDDITEIFLIVLVEILGYYATGVGPSISYGYECRILEEIKIDKTCPSSNQWHRAWIEDTPKLKKVKELLMEIPNLPDWVERGRAWSVS